MVQDTEVCWEFGDGGPFEDSYMLLSAFHRVYWRRGTKFKQSMKPNWKLWLWGRKSVPRSEQHPAKGGPQLQAPCCCCLILRLKDRICLYPSVVLFLICLWLKVVFVFIERMGIGNVIKTKMVRTNVWANSLLSELVICPPLPGIDLGNVRPRPDPRDNMPSFCLCFFFFLKWVVSHDTVLVRGGGEVSHRVALGIAWPFGVQMCLYPVCRHSRWMHVCYVDSCVTMDPH